MLPLVWAYHRWSCRWKYGTPLCEPGSGLWTRVGVVLVVALIPLYGFIDFLFNGWPRRVR